MKKSLLIGAAGAALTISSVANAQYLLVPESSNDRVVILDANNGSVVDTNFIDIAAAAASVGYTGGITPIEAMEVGNQVWVTDQVADRIWRFNADGSFAGQIGVDAMGDGTLNNIRGFEVVGNTAYVAQGSDGAFAEGIVTVDITTGVATGSFIGVDPGDASYQDIKLIGNQLYVTNSDSGNDGIFIYETDGTFSGSFALSEPVSNPTMDFDFLQQINVRASNGNLIVGGFSGPAGVYEFQPDGTPLGIVTGMDSGPRAAWELGNGRTIWTNGNFIASGDAGSESPILSGNSFRYINASTIPAPGALAMFGGVALFARRRRD